MNLLILASSRTQPGPQSDTSSYGKSAFHRITHRIANTCKTILHLPMLSTSVERMLRGESVMFDIEPVLSAIPAPISTLVTLYFALNPPLCRLWEPAVALYKPNPHRSNPQIWPIFDFCWSSQSKFHYEDIKYQICPVADLCWYFQLNIPNT